MKKITHPAYSGYPEHPYISPDRDIKAWEQAPETFPYSRVAKGKMQRLPEGLLPGDVVLLWRVGLGTFTSDSVIPQYFEYKYGVDADASLRTLLRLGYAEQCSATASLPMLTIPQLKKILADNSQSTTGKKQELLDRVKDMIPEKALAKSFGLRCYTITAAGKKILKKYDGIIQKHGPKKL